MIRPYARGRKKAGGERAHCRIDSCARDITSVMRDRRDAVSTVVVRDAVHLSPLLTVHYEDARQRPGERACLHDAPSSKRLANAQKMVAFVIRNNRAV